ncbi:1,3-beta-glucan synthase [Ceratobasidium theobromae]|uniref:1,3-beta-glucan synthase n=1 Tax=Ceratobasidium theobromae TaxID=1582974 RepID=A0A5N5QAF5_9AGAM|nr:1,3-beta-glucan synthase [Ceratobasidium theobromae]
MQAYARLPLWKPGSSGPCFYPWAPLPGTTWLNELMLRWSKPSIPIDALSTIKTLLSRYNVIWTVGAIGNSKATNTANWYNRSRGLHQIVAHCYAATSFGPLEARLGKVRVQSIFYVQFTNVFTTLWSQAIEILEDPRLRTALMSLKTGRDHRDLVTECCASKSSGVDYPILYKLYPAWPEYKSVEEMKSKLGKFRTALKNAIVGPNPSIDIPTAVQEHHISKTIRTEFWETFDIASWALGWGDTNREKEIKTTSALVGWGYLQDAFCERVLPRYMEEYPDSRWLLQTVRDVCNMRQREPWWENELDYQASLLAHTLPLPPTNPEATRTPLALTNDLPEPFLEPDSTPPRFPNVSSKSRDAGIERTTSPEQGSSSSAMPVDNPSNVQLTVNLQPEDLMRHKRVERQDDTLEDDVFEGGWDVEQNDLEVPKTYLVAEVRPSYIIASHALSTRVLQNLDGQVLFSRHRRGANDEIDGETIKRIRAARSSHQQFMVALLQERKRLRESILMIGKLCKDMPYGAEFALTGLQATMSNMKDIYVSRVALLLMDILELSKDEAINEAASIAWTDGLYGADLASVSDLCLKIELAGTLTADASYQVVEPTLFDFGPLRIPGREPTENAYNVSRLMESFRVARGYGGSEAESELAAIDSVATRAFIQKRQKEGEERFWDGRSPIEDIWSDKDGCADAIEELILRDPGRKYEAMFSVGPKRKLTARDRSSGFSTGKFSLGSTFDKALPAVDGMTELLKNEWLETASMLESTWSMVAEKDIASWAELRQSFLNKLI